MRDSEAAAVLAPSRRLHRLRRVLSERQSSDDASELKCRAFFPAPTTTTTTTDRGQTDRQTPSEPNRSRNHDNKKQRADYTSTNSSGIAGRKRLTFKQRRGGEKGSPRRRYITPASFPVTKHNSPLVPPSGRCLFVRNQCSPSIKR